MNFWNSLMGRGEGEQRRPDGFTSPLSDIHTQIELAHRDWQAAQQHFQMVHEPDLVDHAIFQMEAAQRKYMFLLRQLKQAQQGEPPDSQEGEE